MSVHDKQIADDILESVARLENSSDEEGQLYRANYTRLKQKVDSLVKNNQEKGTDNDVNGLHNGIGNNSINALPNLTNGQHGFDDVEEALPEQELNELLQSIADSDAEEVQGIEISQAEVEQMVAEVIAEHISKQQKSDQKRANV